MKQNLRNPLYPSHTHDKLNLTSFNAHVRKAIDAASLSQSNTCKPQEISWSTLPSYCARQNFRKLCSELKQPDTIRSSAARLIMNDLNNKMPHTHKGKQRIHTSKSMSKLKKWMPSTTTENEQHEFVPGDKPAWLARFKIIDKTQRTRTRAGTWHALLRYQEQNEIKTIQNITQVNYKKRAKLTTTFAELPDHELCKLTATVSWKEHNVHPNHLELAKQLYPA